MKWKHVRRRWLQEPALALIFLTVRAVLVRLPLGGIHAVARWVGMLAWCWPPVRRMVLANLALVFPERSPAERRRLGRTSLGNSFLTPLELLWFAHHPERLRPAIDLSAPTTQTMLAEFAGDQPRQGCIFMSPHVGSWEFAGQTIALSGLPMHAVAARVRNAVTDRAVNQARQAWGMRIIPARGAVRGLVGAIRAGHAVGLLVDQNTQPDQGGVFVPFFGLPVAVTRAPAALARKLNCPIILGVALRLPDGRFQLDVEAVVRQPAAFASDETLTAELVRLQEAVILRHPEQYLWFYDRWRLIPADCPPDNRARYPYYAREWNR
jgi:Kdo2-lipid IVA lauroyltransferase/acyltransferase